MSESFGSKSRTALLAGMQTIPAIGGALAQIVGDNWRAPFEKKIESFLDHLVSELRAQGISVESFRDRFATSEVAQSMFQDVVSQTLRSTADRQRKQLASALARGLTSKDRDLADMRFLLRAWGELDEVEQAIFVVVSRFGFSDDDAEHRFPEIFGPDYYGIGADTDTAFLRDSAHRCRINHMMSVGLLRPRDERAWKEGGVRVDKLTSYFPTKVGEKLAALLGLETR